MEKRASFVVGLLMFLPFLCLGAQPVGAEHDDALYILASQALARGHYRMWFLPWQPRFINGPPGLPALLLPVSITAPENLLLYQGLMALFAAAALFFFWRALKTLFPWEIALPLTALLAGNPVFLFRSSAVMPEVPALALCLFFWWKRPRLSGRATGTCLLAAYLVRPAALALWAADWGTRVIQRGRKKFFQNPSGRKQKKFNPANWEQGAIFFFPLVGLALWRWWSQPGGGLQEKTELSLFYHADITFFKTALRVAVNNLREIFLITGQSFLPVAWAKTKGAIWIGGGLWTAALGGLWTLKTPERLFLLLFALAQGAMHAFWPYWYSRYLVPLLPILLVGLGNALGKRISSRKTSLVLTLLFGMVFLGHSIYWFRPAPPSPTRDLHAWIRAHTPPQALCTSFLYGRDALYTGRIFIPFPVEKSEADFHTDLEKHRVRFILWDKETTDFGFSLPTNSVRPLRERTRPWLENEQHFRRAYEDSAGLIFERVD